jgi:bacteriocin biosynthesis cyclodehydratase domain-containing protein
MRVCGKTRECQPVAVRVIAVESFSLFWAGAFGAAVARRIGQVVPDVRIFSLLDSAVILDALVSRVAFVGLALWRPYHPEMDRVDDVCARYGIPWSSVVLDGPNVQCGPLVAGHGPCYKCYRKRRLTHSPYPDREQALDTFYASDPTLGILGFTPSGVQIAAAALLLDREERDNSKGRIRRINLLDCNIEEAQVVRVHGCSRCSHETTPGARYTDNLVAALREQQT